MATTNPITGDKIQTKPNSKKFRDNYALIEANRKKKNKQKLPEFSFEDEGIR